MAEPGVRPGSTQLQIWIIFRYSCTPSEGWVKFCAYGLRGCSMWLCGPCIPDPKQFCEIVIYVAAFPVSCFWPFGLWIWECIVGNFVSSGSRIRLLKSWLMWSSVALWAWWIMDKLCHSPQSGWAVVSIQEGCESCWTSQLFKGFEKKTNRKKPAECLCWWKLLWAWWWWYRNVAFAIFGQGYFLLLFVCF